MKWTCDPHVSSWRLILDCMRGKHQAGQAQAQAQAQADCVSGMLHFNRILITTFEGRSVSQLCALEWRPVTAGPQPLPNLCVQVWACRTPCSCPLPALSSVRGNRGRLAGPSFFERCWQTKCEPFLRTAWLGMRSDFSSLPEHAAPGTRAHSGLSSGSHSTSVLWN